MQHLINKYKWNHVKKLKRSGLKKTDYRRRDNKIPLENNRIKQLWNQFQILLAENFKLLYTF